MAPVRAAILCAALLALAPAAWADGLTSTGNTDGVLTWRLGALGPGQSAREVVLFTFGDSPDAATKLLEAARQEFAAVFTPLSRKDARSQATVWIRNAATNFALSGPGHFFWEGGRQSLTGPAGGQLSRFGWYVHYNDGADRRAGTPISDRAAENLRVTGPPAAVAADQAVLAVETADGQLRIRLHAKMGAGAVAAVEFLATNTGTKALSNVHLSAYANLSRTANCFVH